MKSSGLKNYALREQFPYSELFWSVFSRIRIECGNILRISPYSVRIREKTNQNNSTQGDILRSHEYAFHKWVFF